MIERLSDMRGMGRQQLLANSIKNLIHMKKKVTRCGPKFTKHQNLVDS